jgi:hypothetical protein
MSHIDSGTARVCTECDEECNFPWQCHCCLAATVSHLSANIQRVRDVCKQDSFWINHAKAGGWGRALTVAQVLAALDGGTDE